MLQLGVVDSHDGEKDIQTLSELIPPAVLCAASRELSVQHRRSAAPSKGLLLVVGAASGKEKRARVI